MLHADCMTYMVTLPDKAFDLPRTGGWIIWDKKSPRILAYPKGKWRGIPVPTRLGSTHGPQRPNPQAWSVTPPAAPYLILTDLVELFGYFVEDAFPSFAVNIVSKASVHQVGEFFLGQNLLFHSTLPFPRKPPGVGLIFGRCRCPDSPPYKLHIFELGAVIFLPTRFTVLSKGLNESLSAPGLWFCNCHETIGKHVSIQLDLCP